MVVVISQSMYFPWVGLLEQIRLADVFVHYDDVQFSRGSLVNRVQAKTGSGSKWLKVPLRDQHLGQLINEVRVDNRTDWRRKHRDLLCHAYQDAPFREEMLSLIDGVLATDCETLADISRESMMALVRYFGLDDGTIFQDSAQLGVSGSGSKRVHGICRALGATVYVTGHGARRYLDHDLFERSRIRVEYMKYRMQRYPQLHGDFTPYVTGLDLVANCGRAGRSLICSGSTSWQEFLSEAD
mgnify:CR=1 FL=1